MAVFRYLIFSLAVFFPALGGAQETGTSQALEVTPLAIESAGGLYEFEVEVARTPQQHASVVPRAYDVSPTRHGRGPVSPALLMRQDRLSGDTTKRPRGVPRRSCRSIGT